MSQADGEGASSNIDPQILKRLSRCDLKKLLGEVIERSLVIERRMASLVDAAFGT